MEISYRHSFEYAHRLRKHDGKCRNIHGHSAEIVLTLAASLSAMKYGMLLDFGSLKHFCYNDVDQIFDHALLCSEDDPQMNKVVVNVATTKYRVLTENREPTAEGLALEILDLLGLWLKAHHPQLLEKLDHFSVEFFEGPNASAKVSSEELEQWQRKASD